MSVLRAETLDVWRVRTDFTVKLPLYPLHTGWDAVHHRTKYGSQYGPTVLSHLELLFAQCKRCQLYQTVVAPARSFMTSRSVATQLGTIRRTFMLNNDLRMICYTPFESCLCFKQNARPPIFIDLYVHYWITLTKHSMHVGISA